MGKVVYIARTVPHYRERILDRLSNEVCDLEVTGGGRSHGLGKETTLPFLREVRLWAVPSPFGRGKVYWQTIAEAVREIRPDVVISEFGLSLLHLHWLFALRRRLGFKLAFWTHGMGVGYRGPARSLADKLRVRMLRSADGLFYYTGGCREALRGEIGDAVPSWVVWNTLDTEAMNVTWEGMTGDRSPSSAPYVVFLGRLIESKRVDEIPPLARRLKESVPDLRWKIIGSGEKQSALEEIAAAEDLPVDFLGPITDEEEKGRWLKHAVAMVCPGMLGLNVVDAVGYGCPILSFGEQPAFAKHSPEVEYLHEGEDGNGALADSEEEMAAWIRRLHEDTDLRARMGSQARETFLAECSIKRQLEGFRRGLRELGGSGTDET